MNLNSMWFYSFPTQSSEKLLFHLPDNLSYNLTLLCIWCTYFKYRHTSLYAVFLPPILDTYKHNKFFIWFGTYLPIYKCVIGVVRYIFVMCKINFQVPIYQVMSYIEGNLYSSPFLFETSLPFLSQVAFDIFCRLLKTRP